MILGANIEHLNHSREYGQRLLCDHQRKESFQVFALLVGILEENELFEEVRTLLPEIQTVSTTLF